MGVAERSYIYLKFVVKGIFRYPGIRSLYSNVKYYPSWQRYLAPGRNSVVDRMPWIAFSAIEYLQKIVRPDMCVFEYGSGGSTLFWASRVKELVSVEHDRPWFEKIHDEIGRQQLSNVKYILKEAVADPAFDKKDFRVPADYISSDKNFMGKNFAAYVKVIDSYPDEYFDVITVDGRARPSCIAHAMRKLKPGQHYLAPFSFDRQSWKVRVFYGPVPYISHFSETTILNKTNNSTK